MPYLHYIISDILYHLHFYSRTPGNKGSTPLAAIAVQLNNSAFGISPVNPQITLPTPVSNGRYDVCSILMHVLISNIDINHNTVYRVLGF